MNAKQAAKAAKKLEEQAKNPVSKKTVLEKLGDVVAPAGRRENFPGGFEEKYTCEELKERIADHGMWAMIPAVTYDMDSPKGIMRLEENDVLFTFIDQYFRDIPFAFEPNMRDGRFVFLPHNVSHAGIGICASKAHPGFLEIGHFWYPWEFTQRYNLDIDQVYIPQYSIRPGLRFANQIRNLYSESLSYKGAHYCTFPFDTDILIRLEGRFLDDLEKSFNTIREALKNSSPEVQRNGEGLILFMQRIMVQGG